MNFAIRYLTEYRYETPVTDNLNALRVKPATTATQRVDDFGVRVDPESRLHQHRDYFGTTVIEFGISRPHDHLSIDVRARVKTTPPDDPPDASWADLDFRARTTEDEAAFAATLGVVQRELAQVDADIAQRYFGGAGTPAARLVTA